MTARGSRSVFATPDAVTDLRDIGDRVDLLERIPAATTGSLIDSWTWTLEELPEDFSNVYAGQITIPVGWSKLEVFAGFTVNEPGADLSGAGIVFEGDFEERNMVVGGITSGSPLGLGVGVWTAQGVALVRSTGRKRVRFYAKASTDGGTTYTRGVLFVTPIRSVSLEA